MLRPGRGAGRRARRPAPVHRLGPADPHRLGRLPGLQPRREREDHRGGRRRSSRTSTAAASALARAVDRDPGDAGRRHHHGVRRVPAGARPSAPYIEASLGAHHALAAPLREGVDARAGSALFGIVQGGLHRSCGARHVEEVCARRSARLRARRLLGRRDARGDARRGGVRAPLLPAEQAPLPDGRGHARSIW